MSDDQTRLRLTEIFYSLQGESTRVGLPTVFIRLTGCPLRCQYCDTSYAFSGGEWHSINQILEQLKFYNCRYICVTGGEPLAQKACVGLLQRLCDEGYSVSLETSGAIDISTVDTRVVRVMDIKTPGSGEDNKNLYSNIEHLTDSDEIKFVISDRQDYDWAKQIIEQYDLLKRCELLFSPVHGAIEARSLAEWILQDQLAVRFQVQLHKYLWDNQPGK
ncbi:MAG: 7-carboxy-7-deazaguanine synthase QueE [Gammaproteobacteria bacterium]|nr:7-carboxy-7-deazaguanine synthase QueE [Gammaproteobacteria bacterium]